MIPYPTVPGAMWSAQAQLVEKSYTCGYCDHLVASDRGYHSSHGQTIHICGNCKSPTYFWSTNQVPGVAYGVKIEHLPTELDKLYNEARNCCSVQSFTAAVLVCRKILLHIAHDKHAPDTQTFVQCVEYLASKGYVPPDGKEWVDTIRTKSNEANHEITLMTELDAKQLIDFLEMLLRFIYEFPGRIPKKSK